MRARKKKDEVEVVPLGKQPVVEKIHGAVGPDGKPMHLFKGKLEEQFEYRASGKAVRELVGMASKTIEKRNELDAKLDRQFGYDKIADQHGHVHRRRLDEIEELKWSGRGWGSKPTRQTFVVPDMPWKKPRDPRPGRTRIRTVNGVRVETYKPA